MHRKQKEEILVINAFVKVLLMFKFVSLLQKYIGSDEAVSSVPYL